MVATKSLAWVMTTPSNPAVRLPSEGLHLFQTFWEKKKKKIIIIKK